MNKIWKMAIVGFSLVFLAGCTIRLVDFTVISSKNVKLPTKARGKRVTGTDCIPVVVVPFGIPNMKEAIDKAIEDAGEDYDALVDGVLYQLNHFFIVGQMCYKVEGTPINTKAAISMNEDEKKNVWFHSKRYGSIPGG